MTVIETAYAKINLALHVRGRREDGYHDIETLFAFVDCGDTLTARPANRDAVTTHGEFADQLADPIANIVAKTLNVLPRSDALAIVLEKNLPVAAGLGGGSADAGAVFRIVRDVAGLPDDWMGRATRLGADVLACVESRTCIGRGIGAELEPVENDLAGTPCLLINPRVPLSTADVFANWDGRNRGAMPPGTVSQIAEQGANHLENAAVKLCAPIDDVMAALRNSGAFVTRMSGSGATCFALYHRHDAMVAAASRIAQQYPNWWQLAGRLK